MKKPLSQPLKNFIMKKYSGRYSGKNQTNETFILHRSFFYRKNRGKIANNSEKMGKNSKKMGKNRCFV
jgi:hypothetical protein